MLRAACDALAKETQSIAPAELLAKLFGGASKSNDAGDPEKYDLPDRGLLIAGDLSAQADKDVTTTRIEIDDETGAVKTGALQVMELAAPFGAEVQFRGEFLLQALNGVDPPAVEKLLSLAINLIPAIGAFKSAGFGEVVAGRVTLKEVARIILATGGTAAERMAYRVTFDRPFLVDAVRETDNLFVGSVVVPGAALKGALAAKLALAGVDPERDPEWSTALANLRISHAFPENDDGRLSRLPLPASLCVYADRDDLEFADGLHEDVGAREFGERWLAPLYPVDWKDEYFDELSKRARLPHRAAPSPQPRTHVRIDPGTFVAADQDLFTTVAQGVYRGDGKKRAWRIVVDFDGVTQGRRAQLQALIEDGLYAIGRTGACAVFEKINSACDAESWGRIRLAMAPAAAPVSGHDDLYALTLITPALLTDPKEKAKIEEQYKNQIESQTGGELLRCYTSRRLAGGYVAMRRRPYGKTYYPFVLTEPGSVFLVRSNAPEKLEHVARFGLAPVALKDAKPLDWRNCPYLPENGYGEVAFSLIDPAQLKEQEGAYV